MKNLWCRWRDCCLNVMNRPFGMVVAVNDIANFLFGIFYLLALGNSVNSDIYQSVVVTTNSLLWPGLLIATSVVSQVGFALRNRLMVSMAALLSNVSWLFAFVLLVIQTGNIWVSLPLVIRPLAISFFTKIKVSIDKDWHNK
jgi:hypothetical protein